MNLLKKKIQFEQARFIDLTTNLEVHVKNTEEVISKIQNVESALGPMMPIFLQVNGKEKKEERTALEWKKFKT